MQRQKALADVEGRRRKGRTEVAEQDEKAVESIHQHAATRRPTQHACLTPRCPPPRPPNHRCLPSSQCFFLADSVPFAAASQFEELFNRVFAGANFEAKPGRTGRSKGGGKKRARRG